MPKFKTVYTCKNCGYTSYQWIGQCPNCNEWNSFVEDDSTDDSSTDETLKEDNNENKVE